jgi:RHS repeat-associated protein
MPSRGADVQPYKYNGKELDRMHGLNTYDYGARQYDPTLCRWDRMDRRCEKYYNVSPYSYCANNPVNATDPNGDTIRVSISNIACAEKGPIRVIMPQNNDQNMVYYVPLYQLAITDDETGEKSYYQVTREALSSDDGYSITNYAYEAYEPYGENGEYLGVWNPDYPRGSGYGAICLTDNGERTIKSDLKRPVPTGEKLGEAFDIMIHVGGYYHKKDGNLYIAGSKGCYGLYGGDEEIIRFNNDFQNRWSRCPNDPIKVSVFKRKNVIWHAKGNPWE